MRIRRWLLAAACVLAATPAMAADEFENAAFVDTEIGRGVAYVGEAVTVRLVVGYDLEIFARSVIQPFQRELDIPVHVEAQWTEGMDGVTLLESVPVEAGETFALNDDVVVAERGKERRALGHVFQTVVVSRRFEPLEVGRLVIPAPRLRFAYATEFREDFVQGRVPKDRHDRVIDGAPFVLTVLPVPDAGRPEGYTGGIGRFTIAAETDAVQVEVGKTFTLTVRIEGVGNFGFGAPRLDDVPGLHVYGTIDESTPSSRTIAYDVAVTAHDVLAIPAIPFAFFDPTVSPPGYRVAWTDEIPLTVTGGASTRSERPVRGGNASDASGEDGGESLGSEVEQSEDDGSVALPIAVFLFLGLALMVVVRSRSKSKEMRNVTAEEIRRFRADEALASFQVGGDADLADVFAEVIAAHLDVPAASVIGPDVLVRLERSGASPDLARSVAALLERLVAGRYGGAAASADDVATARRLAVELSS